jgi:hypothetical protein
MNEFILVRDWIKPPAGGSSQFTVPLLRGYNGTAAQKHDRGLWLIVITPHQDFKQEYLGDVALRLPAMSVEATEILVGHKIAFYLDPGYVLVELRVIEDD